MLMFLKNCNEGYIVSLRGKVYKINYVTAFGHVEMDACVLNEQDDWVDEPHNTQWPMDQQVRLLAQSH
jgi:hypothetical protein